MQFRVFLSPPPPTPTPFLTFLPLIAVWKDPMPVLFWGGGGRMHNKYLIQVECGILWMCQICGPLTSPHTPWLEATAICSFYSAPAVHQLLFMFYLHSPNNRSILKIQNLRKRYSDVLKVTEQRGPRGEFGIWIHICRTLSFVCLPVYHSSQPGYLQGLGGALR